MTTSARTVRRPQARKMPRFPRAVFEPRAIRSRRSVGSGLHVAAYYIGHEAHIGATTTVLTVAVPLAVYVLTLFALYTFLVRAVDPFHIALLAGTAALLVLPVLLATIGAPMAVCLVVLMLAPLVPVIGYEAVGYRHMAIAVHRTLARGQQAIG
jgi:hypothetical protein